MFAASVNCGTSQETELGQVIYANSITLTPGTVTIAIDKDIMVIHALTVGSATGLQTGEMDRRVTAMEAHPEAPTSLHQTISQKITKGSSK